jgi:hypothetical protein
MPLIIPANSITGGYEVDNSLRFDDGSSDNLTRTPSSNGNKQIWTWSGWVKRGAISTWQGLFQAGSNNNMTDIHFYTDDKLYVRDWNGSSLAMYLVTNRLFRDVSAWYHLVVAVDTTQSTASNRVKIYINGTQETSFSTEDYPTQNLDTNFNDTSHQNIIGIAYQISGSAQYYDGYMAEVVFIDGQQLDPTSFGEFDEDTGIWKPIDVSGLTFGTNGFYFEFKDSSALGDDTSGNGNDFTVNNLTSIDQTTDTPSNNFATLNSLNIDPALSYTFSNGNLDVSIAESGGEGMTSSTLSVSQGKWYWECKLVTSSAHGRFGVVPTSIGATGNPGEFGIAWQMNDATMQLVNTIVSGSWGSNPSNNDILMFALDCDNQAFYFGVNGTWRNSGDPTSGASKTGGVDYSGESTLTSDYLTIGFGGNFFGGGGVQLGQYNFGNPSFTISSGNSDANGYGNFEYAVPSGYYALNTKNLAEYG